MSIYERCVQSELLCAIVVKQLPNLKQQGVLNVLCVLLPQLASVEDEMKVVMPQSKEVHLAVFSIYENLPTGSRRLTLSLAMVNCWDIITEVVSAARTTIQSGGADPSPSYPYVAGRPRSPTKVELPYSPSKGNHTPKSSQGPVKTSQRPCKNIIGLHSQNVKKFPKHSKRCTKCFDHFRQHEH